MATDSLYGVTDSTQQYEAPQVIELGNVVELTQGTAADDTADQATAKYW
jgi:hypothetical protein